MTNTPQNPDHYKQGGIEPWDYIYSNNMGFFEGAIVKYVTRYQYKNGVEDLKKAKTFLDSLITRLETDSEPASEEISHPQWDALRGELSEYL